ncbi:MAG: hypothetical protein ACOZAJ_01475 [Patescibacteria group bacterium]
MEDLKINVRMTDTIAILIKVLAESPSDFFSFISGYFSHQKNLEDEETLFMDFNEHLGLLTQKENHEFFRIGDLNLNELVSRALNNFVNNPDWIPKNRFAKRFITKLVDYCHSGHFSSAVVDAHPLAIKLGFYSY